jgi:pyruvate/2-oxoglutarate dehydrogenase complex dihydrolipoamide acyltransferase (E2) component
MPQQSMGATEVTLTEWFVLPGDAVQQDAVIALAETAKAIVEVVAPSAGRVAELLVKPGTDVMAGDVLATIETTP